MFQKMKTKKELLPIRYDLVPQRGLNEVNKVLTSKLENHEINEWRKGLKWSDAICAFEKKTGIKLNEYWNGSYQIREKLEELSTDEEFWTTLPTKHLPSFEPDMYITSRSIPVEWTKKNLEANGFPCAPVYCVPWNESKIQLMKEHNVSILIDDKPANYLDAIENGIFCYLMDAPHNRYMKNIGHRRIYDLNLNLK